ncbi:MAG: acetyl-CoA carboxylase carboxyl transferase subunit alpha, partial [Vibrionaceae bacterium]
GGAHRHVQQMSDNIKAILLAQLADLQTMDKHALRERRYQRLISYGYCE